MYTSLLDLTNHARTAATIGDHHTVEEAAAEVGKRLRLPRHSIAGELHGRKAVDAAFNLALAGQHADWVFDELCSHAESEVQRWGRRRTCSSMTLSQLAERTAAAGCRSPLGLYQAISDILQERAEPTFANVAHALTSGDYSLTSSLSAARWVYRASARNDKEASASADGFAATDWGDVTMDAAHSSTPPSEGLGTTWADCRRPLTIDLGSGFGCGPLAYAADAESWQGDNVLGCDLSAAGIGFARGVARRWGVSDRCKFVRDDARRILRAARETYPGTVQRVILSCPTPYAQIAADTKGAGAPCLTSGNAQLPASVSDPCFLGHVDVIEAIYDTLAPGGLLFLASNVEDVAVTLLGGAEQCGFHALTSPTNELACASWPTDARVGGANDAEAPQPRRQQVWASAGGMRADGSAWRAAPGPMAWASETERTYYLERRQVHRVVCRKE